MTPLIEIEIQRLREMQAAAEKKSRDVGMRALLEAEALLVTAQQKAEEAARLAAEAAQFTSLADRATGDTTRRVEMKVLLDAADALSPPLAAVVDALGRGWSLDDVRQARAERASKASPAPATPPPAENQG